MDIEDSKVRVMCGPSQQAKPYRGAKRDRRFGDGVEVTCAPMMFSVQPSIYTPYLYLCTVRWTTVLTKPQNFRFFCLSAYYARFLQSRDSYHIIFGVIDGIHCRGSIGDVLGLVVVAASLMAHRL